MYHINNKDKIIIAFDGKRASSNNTGLGNYSRFILETISNYYNNYNYISYIPQKASNQKYNNIINRYDCLQSKLPKSFFWRKILNPLWRQLGVTANLKRDKVTIYHGLSNELPFFIPKNKIKTLVTIHDLIFIRYPQFYKGIDRYIYKFKLKHALKNADKIIAVSECTKRDIVSFFNIDTQKIEVVYQSCSVIFSKSYSQETQEYVKNKYKLPENYILNVGTIEERKNALLIVKAMRYIDSDVKLVILGRKTDYIEQINKYILQYSLSDRVLIFDRIDNEDLPLFYLMSKIFVYPSIYEGFGIPIIEALSMSKPVIATKGSCLEEAGGQNSIYVSADDEDELAKAIDKVLKDTDLQNKMIKEGLEYVKKFDDKIIAENLMKCYIELL